MFNPRQWMTALEIQAFKTGHINLEVPLLKQTSTQHLSSFPIDSQEYKHC